MPLYAIFTFQFLKYREHLRRLEDSEIEGECYDDTQSDSEVTVTSREESGYRVRPESPTRQGIPADAKGSQAGFSLIE